MFPYRAPIIFKLSRLYINTYINGFLSEKSGQVLSKSTVNLLYVVINYLNILKDHKDFDSEQILGFIKLKRGEFYRTLIKTAESNIRNKTGNYYLIDFSIVYLSYVYDLLNGYVDKSDIGGFGTQLLIGLAKTDSFIKLFKYKAAEKITESVNISEIEMDPIFKDDKAELSDLKISLVLKKGISLSTLESLIEKNILNIASFEELIGEGIDLKEVDFKQVLDVVECFIIKDHKNRNKGVKRAREEWDRSVVSTAEAAEAMLDKSEVKSYAKRVREGDDKELKVRFVDREEKKVESGIFR